MIPRAAGRVAAAWLSCLLFAPQIVSPISVGIDTAAIQQAVRLGSSQDEARLARFHADYRVAIDDPVVRRIEIVTEYRRVVQMSEERAGLRDTTWDAARAERELQPSRGLVDLVLSLQFSPKNTYRTLPDYSLVIYGRGRRASAVTPIDTRTTQSYVASQPAPTGTPILAATFTATFDASRLNPNGRYLAGILLDGREIRRVEIDLGAVK